MGVTYSFGVLFVVALRCFGTAWTNLTQRRTDSDVEKSLTLATP